MKKGYKKKKNGKKGKKEGLRNSGGLYHPLDLKRKTGDTQKTS